MSAAPLRMANIPSQIKRNQRALRERFENRHYTSQIKTYFRSADYTKLHRTDAEFIDDVYRGILHRAPDEKGREAWLAALNSGFRKGGTAPARYSFLCLIGCRA